MTDYIQFHLPVVDRDGPEFPEGVYRSDVLGIWPGGGTAYLTMLAYIVQIWASLYHRSWAGTRFPLKGITGDYTFDASQDADQKFGKEWRVSNVAISIDSYPPKGNTIFGSPGLIHAGYFAWTKSTFQQDALDWAILPNSADSGFQTSGFLGVDLSVPWGDLKTTGSTPTTLDTVQNGTWNTQLQQQPAQFEVSVQTFGSVPPVRRSKYISAGAAKGPDFHYPLMWLNWERMWMEAPDPNINGFTLKLKPGVVASINVGMTRRDPEVSYGGAETESAAFNPMKGGPI